MTGNLLYWLSGYYATIHAIADRSIDPPWLSKGEHMSTVIIGGGGRAAVNKLSEHYHSFTSEQKAAAVALETQFVADVEALCAEAGRDGMEPEE